MFKQVNFRLSCKNLQLLLYLFVHLDSGPVRAVSQREVEEGVRIARVEGQEDASQVTGSVQEGVAYVPQE